MSQTGRPPLLNETKLQVVCAILSKGGTLVEAAGIVGCHVRTLQREWHRNDQFRDDVKIAKCRAILSPYEVMRRAARSRWRAAQWMIQRDDARKRRK